MQNKRLQNIIIHAVITSLKSSGLANVIIY
nr:MAG TPA: hypothetical protein [Inoviridae sp.]